MKGLIYLCGAIFGLSDAECNNWRSAVKRNWGAAFCLDPMRRDGRGREQQEGVVAEIVEGDKLDIMQCAGLIVYYDQPSVGTSMEILFAWEQGKPIALVNASGKPDQELSVWLRYHCTVFADIRSALDFLNDKVN